MSIFLRSLLPNSPWVIAAISDDFKEVRTFLPSERESANDYIYYHRSAGRQIRALAGRSKLPLSRAPKIEDVDLVCAVGVRIPLSAKASLRKLKNPPAISFECQGKLVAAWRFANPVSTRDAARAEQALADRLHGDRLNFFIPVPRDDQAQHFGHERIEPKEADAQAILNDSDEEDEEFVRGDLVTLKRAPPVLKKGWIPAEAVTLFIGRPKRGKSLAVAKMSSYITAGGIWFDGERVSKEARGSVLLIEEEDSREETLARCKAAGCDMSKVHVRVRVPDISNEAQLKKVTDFAEKLGDCRMISFSPLQSAIPSKDYNEGVVRAKLRPIIRWARGRGIAIVGVIHTDKEGKNVAGSDVIVRACRSGLGFEDHPDDMKIADEFDRRRVMRIKLSNSGKMGTQIPYDIEEVTVRIGGIDIDTARIVFSSPEMISSTRKLALPAPTMLTPELSASVMKYAAALQAILIPAGPPMMGTEVRKAITKMPGFTWGQAVYDAADALDIRREDRNGMTESKLWWPPSMWPEAFDLNHV